MDFPITDLMDEDACYARLVAWLHPDGLGLPALPAAATAWASTAAAAPRSSTTAAATAAGSSTPSPARPCTGTKRRPVELVLIVRGFAQGVPTAQLARELGCDRSELLSCGTGSRTLAFRNRDRMPLDDAVAGGRRGVPERGGKKACRTPTPTTRRGGGPTRPAGHGTWDNDRPPVCGVVGRESGQVRLTVAERVRRRDAASGWCGGRRWPMATVNTDEWGGYNGLPGDGPAPRDGLPRGAGVGAGRRRGRGPRGPRQHAGGAVDGAAELPAAVPGREQEVPVPVRGDVRVGLQRQAGHAGVPPGDPGRESATICPT